MTPHVKSSHFTPRPFPRACRVISKALLVALIVWGAVTAHAATISKANNNTALNVDTSWVGLVVPGVNDIATWDSAILANRSNVLGANLSWAGIAITNVSASGASLTIGGANTLTLGSSGIDMSTATANLTFSATTTVSLGAAQTWTVAAGRLLTMSGTLTGSGNLTLAGSGTTYLANSANNYTGTTTLNTGAVLQLNSTGATDTPLGTGPLVIAGNSTIVPASASTKFINNAITMNANLTLGNSTLASSLFSLTGGIDVGSASRTLTLVSAGTPVSNTPTLKLYGVGKGISGSGGGSLTIANGNGASSPEVWVQVGGPGPDGYFVSTALTIGSGVQMYFTTSNALGSSCSLTVDGFVDLSNKSTLAAHQTIKSLAGSGTVSKNSSTAGSASVLTIDGGAATTTTTFSGNIITGTGGGSVAVTKLGSTKQIFAGANNYTGQTQVNAGTLLINGTHIDSGAVTGGGYGSSGTGHFQVASGATLGGSGRIAGNNSQANSNMVLVQSGGTLAPGDGIGSLKLDGGNISGSGSRVLNMATGAKFAFELSGNGSSADQVVFWNYANGDFLLNSNQIDLTLSGSPVAGTYTVTIFSFYSDNGSTFTSSGILSGLVIGSVGAGITGTPTLNYNAGGQTIQLTYTTIPEPQSWALLGIGVGALLWRVRLKSRQS